VQPRQAATCATTNEEVVERPRILSRFGDSRGVNGGVRSEPHLGVDLKAQLDEEVIAPADGVIRAVYSSPSLGFVIDIEHPQLGLKTSYVHLAKSFVTKGQQVGRGQVIGTVGLFLMSAGVVHLHWVACKERCAQRYGDNFDPQPDRVECFESGQPMEGLTLPLHCRKRSIVTNRCPTRR
jgi:hypothetical protein